LKLGSGSRRDQIGTTTCPVTDSFCSHVVSYANLLTGWRDWREMDNTLNHLPLPKQGPIESPLRHQSHVMNCGGPCRGCMPVRAGEPLLNCRQQRGSQARPSRLRRLSACPSPRIVTGARPGPSASGPGPTPCCSKKAHHPEPEETHAPRMQPGSTREPGGRSERRQSEGDDCQDQHGHPPSAHGITSAGPRTSPSSRFSPDPP
jgi:hypothetical protein